MNNNPTTKTRNRTIGECDHHRSNFFGFYFIGLVQLMEPEICYFPLLVLAVVFIFAADVWESNSKACCTCATLTEVYLATSCFYPDAQINLQFVPSPLFLVHRTIHHAHFPSSSAGEHAFLCLPALLAEWRRSDFYQVKVPSITIVFTFSLWSPIWAIYNLAVKICFRLKLVTHCFISRKGIITLSLILRAKTDA